MPPTAPEKRSLAACCAPPPSCEGGGRGGSTAPESRGASMIAAELPYPFLAVIGIPRGRGMGAFRSRWGHAGGRRRGAEPLSIACLADKPLDRAAEGEASRRPGCRCCRWCWWVVGACRRFGQGCRGGGELQRMRRVAAEQPLLLRLARRQIPRLIRIHTSQWARVTDRASHAQPPQEHRDGHLAGHRRSIAVSFPSLNKLGRHRWCWPVKPYVFAQDNLGLSRVLVRRRQPVGSIAHLRRPHPRQVYLV